MTPFGLALEFMIIIYYISPNCKMGMSKNAPMVFIYDDDEYRQLDQSDRSKPFIPPPVLRSISTEGTDPAQHNEFWGMNKRRNIFLLVLSATLSMWLLAVYHFNIPIKNHHIVLGIEVEERVGTNATFGSKNTTKNSRVVKIPDEVALAHDASKPPSSKLKEATTSETELKLCGRDSVRNGSWVKRQNVTSLYASPEWGLRCPLELQSYKWLPDKAKSKDCAYTEWNNEQFCSLTKGKTLSLIGDSLMWEQYQSLISMHGAQKSQLTRLVTGVNHRAIVCNGQTELIFRRDDYLQEIAESVNTTFPDIIVLNKGAHYKSDESSLETLRKTIRDLRLWSRSCDRRGIKCQLFWRTTAPGHPSCEQFHKPSTDSSFMEDVVAGRSNLVPAGKQQAYHWQDFQFQNQLFEKSLVDSGLNVTFIDGYDLLLLRPDTHLHRRPKIDCLHNCYPGPMDVYNEVLLHWLAVEKESELLDESANARIQLRSNLRSSRNDVAMEKKLRQQ